MLNHPNSPAPQPRRCRIVSGSVEDRAGGGDGAYDLLDVTGTPEAVGRAIGDSLAACDMHGGPGWRSGTYMERGEPLYLTVRIRIEPPGYQHADDECARCGETLEDGDEKCPECDTPRAPRPLIVTPPE
jgi:hypothetical protein